MFKVPQLPAVTCLPIPCQPGTHKAHVAQQAIMCQANACYGSVGVSVLQKAVHAAQRAPCSQLRGITAFASTHSRGASQLIGKFTARHGIVPCLHKAACPSSAAYCNPVSCPALSYCSLSVRMSTGQCECAWRCTCKLETKFVRDDAPLVPPADQQNRTLYMAGRAQCAA